MSRVRSVAVSLALALACAPTASAQSPPVDPPEPIAVQPLSAGQSRMLDDWLAQIDEWRGFQARHDNRPARNAFGFLVDRPDRPASPSWLPAHCASARALGVVNLDERISRACKLLDDPLAPDAGAPLQPVNDGPEKFGTFLTRLHLDGFWVTTSSGPRAYGIIGSHLTLVDVGRVQIFGPPGVLLLRMPDGRSGHRMTLGYTWGVSVRLTDLRMGSSRNMTLFLTMSKVWVSGGNPNQVGSQGYQIAGLSLAPAKK